MRLIPDVLVFRSMRARAVAAIALLLLALVVSLWLVLAERLKSGVNASLDEAAHSILQYAARFVSAEAIEHEDGILAIDPPELPAGHSAVYFELLDAETGRRLLRSLNLQPKETLRRPGLRGFNNGWNVNIRDEQLRCVGEPYVLQTPSGPKGAVLIVGLAAEGAYKRMHEILERSAAALVLTLVLSIAAVSRLIRWGMRPLRELAGDVAAIGPSRLGPVGVPADTDLALVATRLNESLAGVARSLQREKRFSSDVAHELMTPLAGLRAEIEVALLRERAPEEMSAALTHSRAMVIELQQLIETLLTLGRTESARNAAGAAVRERIALRETIDRLWTEIASSAGLSAGEFQNEIAPDAELEANPQLFALAMKNLLTNAARHAPPGARRWAAAARVGNAAEAAAAKWEIRICNEVEPGSLPADFATVGFERFWRGDSSRTKLTSSAGIGLGLSLARSAVEAMGGELRAEVGEGRVCFAAVL